MVLRRTSGHNGEEGAENCIMRSFTKYTPCQDKAVRDGTELRRTSVHNGQEGAENCIMRNVTICTP
jgi:hypothetical protein